jgi:hypothetical protein
MQAPSQAKKYPRVDSNSSAGHEQRPDHRQQGKRKQPERADHEADGSTEQVAMMTITTRKPEKTA